MITKHGFEYFKTEFTFYKYPYTDHVERLILICEIIWKIGKHTVQECVLLKLVEAKK